MLLVEVMRASTEIGAAERRAVLAALHDKFSLSADESARLLELADRTAREATDFFAFTTRINESFTMEQKLRMVEHMWRVAYADGTLSAHENHVMWKVSDLLYIPHGAYVSAKMQARDAAGAA
ncbi:MAG: TerB family tellurite resistance protein [Comamonadaceae bacterium]|nr:TerB family tellurite resistance protein [Comamonadaceae bacterium]